MIFIKSLDIEILVFLIYIPRAKKIEFKIFDLSI